MLKSKPHDLAMPNTGLLRNFKTIWFGNNENTIIASVLFFLEHLLLRNSYSGHITGNWLALKIQSFHLSQRKWARPNPEK
jgi:hypothetical protein